MWSNWSEITVASDCWTPAVYQIRLVSQGKPFTIRRMLGADREGVLNIGQTKSMEIRRQNFLWGMTYGAKHSAGNLLFCLLQHSKLERLVREHRIEYRFDCQKTIAAATLREEVLLKKYIMRHGEPPPLNSAIPKRYGKWPHAIWRLKGSITE